MGALEEGLSNDTLKAEALNLSGTFKSVTSLISDNTSNIPLTISQVLNQRREGCRGGSPRVHCADPLAHSVMGQNRECVHGTG